MTLTDRKEITSIVHNIVVTLAVVIAGFWTLFVFVYTPEASINITHEISAVPLSDGRTFLRVAVKLTNIGNKAEVYNLDSTKIYVEINSLSPSKESLASITDTSINFPAYAKKDKAFNTVGYAWYYFKDKVLIKSNLSKTYYFTFLIPEDINPVSIYSQISGKADTVWELIKKPTYTTHYLLNNFTNE